MKNYKIISSQEWGWFGIKKIFNFAQVEQLQSLGFRFDELFNKYSKSYCNVYVSLVMCLFPDKPHLYFYDGSRFFLPCELTDYYKVLMKEIREDIKELKSIGILK